MCIATRDNAVDGDSDDARGEGERQTKRRGEGQKRREEGGRGPGTGKKGRGGAGEGKLGGRREALLVWLAVYIAISFTVAVIIKLIRTWGTVAELVARRPCFATQVPPQPPELHRASSATRARVPPRTFRHKTELRHTSSATRPRVPPEKHRHNPQNKLY